MYKTTRRFTAMLKVVHKTRLVPTRYLISGLGTKSVNKNRWYPVTIIIASLKNSILESLLLLNGLASPSAIIAVWFVRM